MTQREANKQERIREEIHIVIDYNIEAARHIFKYQAPDAKDTEETTMQVELFTILDGLPENLLKEYGKAFCAKEILAVTDELVTENMAKFCYNEGVISFDLVVPLK